jgi:hypothetical protein
MLYAGGFALELRMPAMKRYAVLLGVLIVLLGVLVVVSFSYTGPSRPPHVPSAADKLLSAAKDDAKRQDKQVFLLFTAPGCKWCESFSRFHADPDVSRIIDKYFALLKIDILETPGGEQMYLENGMVRGAPAFTLLDSSGMFLASSGDADNIGFPAEPHEIERYFECFRVACPSLTDEEIAILGQKLGEMRPQD